MGCLDKSHYIMGKKKRTNVQNYLRSALHVSGGNRLHELGFSDCIFQCQTKFLCKATRPFLSVPIDCW